MILHTQSFVTHRYYYNVKYWPNIGMAMIKAAAETTEEAENETGKERGQGVKRQWGSQASQSSRYEETGTTAGWTTPRKKGWAAKGFERCLKEDSEEDGEQGQDSWTSRKYGKGKGGKRY
eukprot:1858726-Heterocapsa_arctica.AAC.1